MMVFKIFYFNVYSSLKVTKLYRIKNAYDIKSIILKKVSKLFLGMKRTNKVNRKDTP